MAELRPSQEQVLEYRRGTMGIAAVPGSGKTFTLSMLASRLLTSGALGPNQEILIVTLVNSAVDNFRQRIGGFIREQNLLPNVGYRVRTLHGLAHDIVLERPSLVGLSDDFQIVDETEAARIRDAAVDSWIRSHPGIIIDQLINPDLQNKASSIRSEYWPKMAKKMASDLIKEAKNRLMTASDLAGMLAGEPAFPLPLLQLCSDIYTDYARALAYRGAVDFDDLIRLAILALQQDDSFRDRLSRRWPYILEDEAQDSSALQEQILNLLSGPNGNWVRVGDPNQAIFETFTTASPEYLKRFIRQAAFPRALPNSGRNTRGIQELANFLIRWTNAWHPNPELRDALTEPLMQPTPPGDPQPNPEDALTRIEVQPAAFSMQAELAWIASHVGEWLPGHSSSTAAVLVPSNKSGAALAALLKQQNIPYTELLRSTPETRRAIGAVTHILKHLERPLAPPLLATLFRVWHRDDTEEIFPGAWTHAAVSALKGLREAERFVWPVAGETFQDTLPAAVSHETALLADLDRFRLQVQRWQLAAALPIDQLVLTIAQDLFRKPAELALAHKLAAVLLQAQTLHPEWVLADFIRELSSIATNKQNFLGFSDEDTGFDPDSQKGRVLITTYHKAKGLEWDRVYLSGVNNLAFPSALPEDPYHSDYWFMQEQLDLTAEGIDQLESLMTTDPFGGHELGAATREARADIAREGLRRLFVGITRARCELFLSYHTGYRGTNQPALALSAIQSFLEGDPDAPS